ncbi:MAG: alpha-amylase family glycosyl hydrolase [Chitinophagaceae bacterium]
MSKLFPMVSWAQGTNIYETNIRQYTTEGSFNAFCRHLPRLKEMGVETLWLMPITPIGVKGRLGTLGSYYACSSYTKINPEFGNEDDFRALIQQAHTLGMKVIIDWVTNHTGQDHEWTTAHPDFYEKDDNGNFREKNGWSDVYDLDYTNPNLRAAMVDAMQYWVKNFDIDGFRCDMAHLVPLDFWMEARKSCDQTKPLFWLAECDDDQYLNVFDVNYAWRWMHATNALSQNKAQGLNAIVPLLHEDLELLPDACKLWFTSNHDENSWNGTEYEKYGMLARTWAVFTFLFPGIPLIYSGQELPNYKRLAFFEKDHIDWNDDAPQLQGFYQAMLHLRKQNPCFHTTATYRAIAVSHCNDTLAFALQQDNNQVLVLFNFSHSETHMVPVQTEYLAGQYTSLFSGISYDLQNSETFCIEPGGYLVYVKQ